MTPQQIRQATGRSETWLRRHVCLWCEQDLWRAMRGHCCSVWGPKCTAGDHMKRAANIKAEKTGAK